MEDQQGGSFAALFNFSFSRFVTLKLISVIYVLAIVLLLAATIAAVYESFVENTNLGIAALLVSPFIFIISLLVTRVWLELIVVLFRIEENTRKG